MPIKIKIRKGERKEGKKRKKKEKKKKKTRKEGRKKETENTKAKIQSTNKSTFVHMQRIHYNNNKSML